MALPLYSLRPANSLITQQKKENQHTAPPLRAAQSGALPLPLSHWTSIEPSGDMKRNKLRASIILFPAPYPTSLTKDEIHLSAGPIKFIEPSPSIRLPDADGEVTFD
jgi:hypothetical protein